MPVFTYKAVDSKKNFDSGVITANDKQEVVQALEEKGFVPIFIKEKTAQINLRKSVPQIEKITFTRYLSTMLASGMPLTEGMAVLEKETKHPIMKKIVSDVNFGLSQGQPLSAIFANYPKVFDRMFIALTKAGEASGTLGDTFKYLEEDLRAEYGLSQKIKGALLYPGVIFFAMFGISILMFFFILPQVAKVFISMKLPLPITTQVLFTSSIALSKYRLLLIPGIVIGMVSLIVFFSTKIGKKIILKVISPLPIMSTVLKQADLARFTRVFSTLIRSAVPITEALQISLSALSWAKFRDLEASITSDVNEGKSLSEAFSKNKDFPSILTQMIATGEKAGTLDKTLGDLASFYEQEVEETVKKATTLLEPLLMLLVGVWVGAIILSIISPLYSIVGTLQGSQ